MMLHPDVQRKAHEELDRVVGSDRLPEFSDRENLPYLAAVYRESARYATTSLAIACVHELNRWRPVGPLGQLNCGAVLSSDIHEGMSHSLKQDDDYLGYRIVGISRSNIRESGERCHAKEDEDPADEMCLTQRAILRCCKRIKKNKYATSSRVHYKLEFRNDPTHKRVHKRWRRRSLPNIL